MDSPSHAHLQMNNEGRAFMLTRDKGSQEDFLSMFHTPSKELQSFRSKYMDPISSSVHTCAPTAAVAFAKESG